MASTRLLSNEDSIEHLISTNPSVGHKSSASVDGSRHDAEAHSEFLKVLKRRSLPHLPKRSSSLTLPPITPSDSPPSSPVEVHLSRIEWQLWLREFLNGRRPTPPPAIDEYIMLDDREGFRPLDGNNNAMMHKTKNWSSNTDASKVDPLPAGKPLSARYYTLLTDLWRRLPRLKLPVAVHPLIHAPKPIRGIFEAGELPLDLGSNIREGMSQRSREAGAQERGYYVSDEVDNLMPHLNRPFQVSAVEGVNPNTADVELDRSTVSVPPSSPRPAFRQVPLSSNNVSHDPRPSSGPAFPRIASVTNRVISSFQRLNESISLSQAQQILDAALLLNFRMGRTLGELACAAAVASPLDHGEPDGQENASSAHAVVNTAKVIGDEGLAIDDADSGLFQGNMAIPVQRHSLGRVQARNGSVAQVVDSYEVGSDCASFSRMGSTGKTRIRWADANDPEGEEDFAPLQRVRSRRLHRRDL